MKKIKRNLSIALVVALFFLGTALILIDRDTVEVSRLIEKHYIYDTGFLKNNYFVDPSRLVDSLHDRYSEFMSKAELDQAVSELNGDYVGLGFEAIEHEGEYLDILSVASNSPAMKAGLMPKDKIIEIDGRAIKTMEYREPLKLIRGKANTSVLLSIDRNGEKMNLTATREKIETVPVMSAALSENIGYISISDFPKDVHLDFENELNKLINIGIDSLIIDLRGNSGGEIEEIAPIASLFVPNDFEKLFEIEYKSIENHRYTRTCNQKFDGKICLLVNGSTASAAEMLADILKRYTRVTTVGELTFGKGVTQRFFYLNSGSVLKLTAGMYLSPDGNSYDKKGIEPNLTLPMDFLLAKTNYINETNQEYEIRMNSIRPILSNIYGYEKADELIINGDIQLKRAISELT